MFQLEVEFLLVVICFISYVTMIPAESTEYGIYLLRSMYKFRMRVNYMIIWFLNTRQQWGSESKRVLCPSE